MNLDDRRSCPILTTDHSLLDLCHVVFRHHGNWGDSPKLLGWQTFFFVSGLFPNRSGFAMQVWGNVSWLRTTKPASTDVFQAKELRRSGARVANNSFSCILSLGVC